MVQSFIYFYGNPIIICYITTEQLLVHCFDNNCHMATYTIWLWCV